MRWKTFGTSVVICGVCLASSAVVVPRQMKLNAEDGGKRQCILVNNNENGICEKVTYIRNKCVIQGYRDPTGRDIPGLGGSLKYYRTAFVGKHGCRDALDEDRDELAANAGTMLALAEGLDEVTVPKKAEGYWRHYSDGAHRHTLVYHSCKAKELPSLSKEADKIRAGDKDAKISVYVYVLGGTVDVFENEFDDMANIELKPIPEPILDIYRTINGD